MKKQLTEEYFINWWLEKYHNTNLEKVTEEHPEWMDEPQAHTRDFYNTYPCTQEEHDEWYAWAINTVAKHHRISKKAAERSFVFAYLNVAPSVYNKTE